MIMKLQRASQYGPYCFSRDEYYRLGELNFFGDRKVELIGGEILEVPPQSNWHANGIEALAEFFRQAFGSNYWVRVQMPLDLSPLSVPDPDIAVVKGARTTHTGRDNPSEAVIVAEISESTLRDDQTRKMSLYAASDIPEYWIVNLVKRQLEVYRDPMADNKQPFGSRYAMITAHQPGTSVSPLAAPSSSVSVANLFV
jgi:Uma2 family endonuclease